MMINSTEGEKKNHKFAFKQQQNEDEKKNTF